MVIKTAQELSENCKLQSDWLSLRTIQDTQVCISTSGKYAEILLRCFWSMPLTLWWMFSYIDSCRLSVFINSCLHSWKIEYIISTFWISNPTPALRTAIKPGIKVCPLLTQNPPQSWHHGCLFKQLSCFRARHRFHLPPQKHTHMHLHTHRFSCLMGPFHRQNAYSISYP